MVWVARIRIRAGSWFSVHGRVLFRQIAVRYASNCGLTQDTSLTSDGLYIGKYGFRSIPIHVVFEAIVRKQMFVFASNSSIKTVMF